MTGSSTHASQATAPVAHDPAPSRLQREGRPSPDVLAEITRHSSEVARIGGWQLDLRTLEYVWSSQSYSMLDIEPPFTMSPLDSVTFYEPHVQGLVKQAAREAVTHGTPWDLELPARTAIGRPMWVRTQGTAVMEQGEVVKLIGTFQDITERHRTECALMESEARTQRLLRAAAVGLWDWDLVTNTLFFSPEWKAQLGYLDHELANRYESWEEGLHPEDHDRAVAAAGDFRAGTLPRYDVEFRMRHRDGSYRWILAQADLLHDASGTPIRMMGSHIDITRRKLAERALEDSERELRLITSSIPGTVSLVDRELRYRFANRHYQDVFGVSADKVVGRTMREIIGDERFAQVQPHVQRVLTGKTTRFESTFGQPREPRYGLTTYVPHRDDSGAVVGFVVVSLEITEQRRAELALRESEDRFARALDATSDGIWDWSITTGDVYFSPQWARLMGYEPDEVPRTTDFFFSTVHPDDLAHVKHVVEEHLAGRTEAKQDEVRLRMKSGEYRWFLDRGKVVARDPDGQPLRMVGTITDITERKRAESERIKLEAQLRQAQKMESVGRLAGGVAHDFNNMLGVILGHAESALLDSPADESVRHDLQSIREAAERSADITRQLLAFARQQSIVPEVVDLNDRVAGMLKLLPRLLGEDVQLTSRADANLWRIHIDPSQVDQVLTNLCVNARNAIANTGSIIIATANRVLDDAFCSNHVGSQAGDYVCLSVQDTGCGIDAHTLPHIFEPFFTTAETGNGIGLGLATVFGIVSQNGGIIDVSSAPGLGSTFAVYFPRHTGEHMEAPAEELAIQDGTETILLVEDEPALLRVTGKMLQSRGYTVLKAGGPQEAMRIAAEYDGVIHLLLTDVIMPGMNGRDLTGHLQRTRPRLRHLFMSGYPADVIATHGVLDQDVYFIQKPFLLALLTAGVRAALARNVP